MNVPKKQHFVPQLILRNFADADGQLWYFDKTNEYASIVKRAPGSIFFREHYYSIKGSDGKIDTTAESKLNLIETSAGKIIQKICSAARIGKTPNLTAGEKMTWNHFVFTQWKRTPDSFSGLVDKQSAREWLSDAIKTYERTGKTVTQEQREMLLSDDDVEKTWQGVRVRNILHPGINVPNILNTMGIWITRITRKNKAFIVGSKPVVRLEAAKNLRLGTEGVQLWMPIASDVAVTPFHMSGEHFTETLSVEDIRRINLAICDQSSQIAGRSKELILSIVGSR